jgi:diketogulonate reductase-like aldo/keto reductase
MESTHHTVTLNNGVSIPVIGLGVYKIPAGVQTRNAVSLALNLGYRLIDTAAFYGNEADVGRAIIESKIPREKIFVTTKLHPATVFRVEDSFNESLKKLNLDYIDLYLIHWPFLRKKRIWQTLEKIYQSKRVRAIGVSNFTIQDLETVIDGGIVPAVNQVEFHPFVFNPELLQYCKEKNIVVQAHSPLTHGRHLNNTIINHLAKHYNTSPAVILLAWGLQHGVITIPKTVHEPYMRENLFALELKISSADMNRLDALTRNRHVSALSRMADLKG